MRTAFFVVLSAACAASGQLSVVQHVPSRDAVASPNTNVAITFDRALDTSTVTSASVRLVARSAGPVDETFSFADGDRTLVISSDRVFCAGDRVFVTMSDELMASDGSPFGGFSFRFEVRAVAATTGSANFSLLEQHDVSPGSFARIYGGQACDVNQDGFTDLAIITENSSDVRVMLNRADGTGLFHPVMTPTNGTGSTPSPNEAADFNNDGLIDICTANTAGASVSVLLGNGDGTFQADLELPVESGPHGLALLDADGDGDTDIAAANTSANSVSVILNNGDGTFAPASHFGGVGSGPWSLAAADMNGDGFDDLVVGARFSEIITVLLSDGDGTFTFLQSNAAGGGTWMMVTGDLNGDGHTDVTSANGTSNNAGILLNTGNGMLGAVTTYPMPNQVVATDLGDVDGDGDLDWLLSSFGGGAWTMMRNLGDGTFASMDSFPAPSNPACAIILDIDNDQDLDLALLDEIADIVTIMENVGTPCLLDLDDDGAVGITDLLTFLSGWFALDADIDGDFQTTITDLLSFLSAWFVSQGPCV